MKRNIIEEENKETKEVIIIRYETEEQEIIDVQGCVFKRIKKKQTQ